jgi:putative SOS response-associated peptidase YedK
VLETEQVGKSGTKRKQPFVLWAADRSTLALACLYEVWYDKSLPKGAPGSVVPTYTIITTTATDSVGLVHDRMPMAVAPGDWAEWLDPRNHDVDQVRALMSPPVDGSFEMYAVSKLVNSVKNNGPDLLEPLPAER